MSASVPRSFRRDSRLFLWIALLLVLFLNLATLMFFRRAVSWGGDLVERRAGEMLRRVALTSRPTDPAETMERLSAEPDVFFIASYDERGARQRSFGLEASAPARLPTARPPAGQVLYEWRREPPLLLATFVTGGRTYVVALDPGRGSVLRPLSRTLTFVVPLAGAALVVLASLFLRSMLTPYDRLIAAADASPAVGGEHGDEREFVIQRFEATIAALSEKERQLEELAHAQMQRADDLEMAARTLSRSLPTGLLSVDAGGTIVEINESGREILRLPDDARGRAYEEVLAGIPEFHDALTQALRKGTAIGRRELTWRAGPEDRVLGLTATPATGADGRRLGAMALFSDLTEVRRLEQRVALARHLADLGEVSAGAAHEFRNAAAAIDGFADLALRSPERAHEYLKSIRREAQEMSRVTSDFLLFARPEGFTPEPLDLSSVVEAAVAETEWAIPWVRVAVSGDFPEVSGSAVLLRRALVNLLRNAAEAVAPARRGDPESVTVTGLRGDGEVALSVGDRGEGVDPARREKIFLPFFSTKPEGSGFGLAIVARIAELHGGTVEVTARPGGGSLFTLRLPASRPSGPVRREPRSST